MPQQSGGDIDRRRWWPVEVGEPVSTQEQVSHIVHVGFDVRRGHLVASHVKVGARASARFRAPV